MPLEIKILDYGDIELESSFLVLGRDCGRTRRVLTLGFLILGGPYPVVVDTGYRSNQIMETLGMRGLQFHENMIENQLARHGVRMGDVRFVCHTHLHIDHAGKDDLFPMNTTVVLNRRELEYSVSGLMHPLIPPLFRNLIWSKRDLIKVRVWVKDTISLCFNALTFFPFLPGPLSECLTPIHL